MFGNILDFEHYKNCYEEMLENKLAGGRLNCFSPAYTELEIKPCKFESRIRDMEAVMGYKAQTYN